MLRFIDLKEVLNMKKILVLVLIATMMLTAFMALSAAKDATKSTTSMTSITPGFEINNSTKNETNNSTKNETNMTHSLEPANLTTNKTAMASGSEVNNSTKNETNTTHSLEPANLTTNKTAMNKTVMALGPDVNNSATTTTPISEPASTATSATTTTTTPGFDNALGLEGMLQWLDQPVNNFPWYSSDESFYSQAYNEGTFSPFQEFYTTSGTAVVGGIISTPVSFDIAEKTPSRIYYGTGQALPYSQYISTMPSKTNDLWIQGATDWSQYVVSPLGTWLQLVANAPVGGSAGFYDIVQTNTTTSKYSTYQFNQGYNTMNFNADQVGRHMLYFVVNNQPSNVVVVDVFTQT